MDSAQEDIDIINEEPEKLLPSFNPFNIVLPLLAAYGWYVIGALVVVTWAWGRLRPSVKKWQQEQEDAAHHKDPDLFAKKMEAMEAARLKQQQSMDAAAKEYQIKEQERLEKKKQQYIERNEGQGGGNRLGARSEYMPLCGAGTSGGYKAPKKSKCGGGGCGR